MSNSIKVNVENMNPAQIIETVAAMVEQIPYNPEWANGTGYYDGLVDVPFEGTAVRAFKDPSDRWGIILPTKSGNLVIFQRFSDGQSGVAVSNYHENLRGICRMLGFGSSVERVAIWRVLPWLGGPNDTTWHIHENSSELAESISTL